MSQLPLALEQVVSELLSREGKIYRTFAITSKGIFWQEEKKNQGTEIQKQKLSSILDF